MGLLFAFFLAAESALGPAGWPVAGSGKGDALREWEVMQIERAESDDPAIPQMTFYGAPAGRTGHRSSGWQVTGKASRSSTRVTIIPQRIRHWREGKELVAEIVLKGGSKAVPWCYKPADD